jgi:hypothetical protein
VPEVAGHASRVLALEETKDLGLARFDAVLQGRVLRGFQLRIRHTAAHVDREIRYIVERERRHSGGMRHFDPEEAGALDVVQHESRPQVVFPGPNLDVIELHALYVPHVKAV